MPGTKAFLGLKTVICKYFRLCKVPFQQHFPLCVHTDTRASNPGWWYGFQMCWEPSAGLDWVQRVGAAGCCVLGLKNTCSGFCNM